MDSVFTSALFEETIKTCVDELLNSEMTVSGLSKKKIFETLSLILKESIILVDNKYCSQSDGDALGSPFKTKANIFFAERYSRRF